jgi:glucuronoarabinoxylan endo-1,4-beta-xylanase
MNYHKVIVFGALTSLVASCSLDMSRYPSASDANIHNDAAPTDGIAHLSINAEQKYQTLVGFGAAEAWGAEDLTKHPLKAQIYQAIFSDLGLDILRFRNKYDRQDPDDQGGIAAEVEILQQATISLGHAPKLLLSSWSPPGTLKASGVERCHHSDPNNLTDCTLAKDANNNFLYSAFGKYLADSLWFYASSNIYPDFISIQNEPGFIPNSTADNGWEGCYFAANESNGFPGYDQALQAVRDALPNTNPAPKIVGPENQGINNGSPEAYLASGDPQALSNLDAVAHHLYQGSTWRNPDNFNASMAALSSAAGSLPIFETEFDTQNGAATEGGFETAWVIHNVLVTEGASAFLYWDLTVTGQTGCLVAMTRSQFTLRGQYYSMRHFSRFTDPGFVRIDAQSSTPNVRVSAYLAPDSSQLTIVVINVGSSDVQVKLESTNNFTAAASEIYRTVFNAGDAGASDYWASLGSLDSNQPLAMPSRSVATLVLHADIPDAN